MKTGSNANTNANKIGSMRSQHGTSSSKNSICPSPADVPIHWSDPFHFRQQVIKSLCHFEGELAHQTDGSGGWTDEASFNI